MADKMWDILRFLKSPEGEDRSGEASNPDAEMNKRRIDERIVETLEKTEQVASGLAETGRLDPDETGPGESAFLTEPLDASPFSLPESRVARESEAPTVSKESPSVRGTPEGAEGELLKIPVSMITPNPFQPRKTMGEDEIVELSDSIKEFGVLQPILVKKTDAGYELVAGERRLRASQRAGLSEIPALLVDAEPVTQQILALVENIQRKNLSAIEEAFCLNDILSKTGWSQTELSRRMGRSQASIANKLRLLRLDSAVQDLIIAGKLGERQARSLLSLSMEEQRLLAQKAIDEDLSTRAVENLSESWGERSGSRSARRSGKKNRETSEGPAGELLHDLADLINKHRGQGMAAQWQVKEMNQSSLVVEITVDLLNRTGG